MSGVAVVGESRFVLGFQLAGIQNIFETSNAEKLMEVMADRRFGVVIVDDNVMDKLDEHHKTHVQESINPVAVVLSDRPVEDDLRKMIIKSIGVDVWNR